MAGAPATYGFLFGSALYGSGGDFLFGSVTWDELGDPSVFSPVGTLDYATTTQNRLFKQWEDDPEWLSMMDIIAASFAEVEGQLLEINDNRSVSTAFGVQLDDVGELVGRKRNGLDDADYRRAIIVDANTLFSSGTPWELTELVRTLYPDNAVSYREFYPASFVLTIFGLSFEEFKLTLDIMQDTPPAGVGALLEAIPPGEVFGPDSFTANDIEPLGAPGSTSGGDEDIFSLFSHAQKLGT